MKIVPWTSWDEWELVRNLFFAADVMAPFCPADVSPRRKAVELVALWESRGGVPVAVQCTANLTEISLFDSGHELTEDSLRLLYSMSLLRMVNGLVDAQQKGEFASSVSFLASRIGLPQTLVELRHEASHNQLPALPHLRLCAQQALEWLERHYWGAQADHLTHHRHRLTALLDCYHLLLVRRCLGPRPAPPGSPQGGAPPDAARAQLEGAEQALVEALNRFAQAHGRDPMLPGHLTALLDGPESKGRLSAGRALAWSLLHRLGAEEGFGVEHMAKMARVPAEKQALASSLLRALHASPRSLLTEGVPLLAHHLLASALAQEGSALPPAPVVQWAFAEAGPDPSGAPAGGCPAEDDWGRLVAGWAGVPQAMGAIQASRHPGCPRCRACGAALEHLPPAWPAPLAAWQRTLEVLFGRQPFLRVRLFAAMCRHVMPHPACPESDALSEADSLAGGPAGGPAPAFQQAAAAGAPAGPDPFEEAAVVGALLEMLLARCPQPACEPRLSGLCHTLGQIACSLAPRPSGAAPGTLYGLVEAMAGRGLHEQQQQQPNPPPMMPGGPAAGGDAGLLAGCSQVAALLEQPPPGWAQATAWTPCPLGAPPPAPHAAGLLPSGGCLPAPAPFRPLGHPPPSRRPVHHQARWAPRGADGADGAIEVEPAGPGSPLTPTAPEETERTQISAAAAAASCRPLGDFALFL
ncbi:putative Ribosomal biogenesis protein LAS1L [Paratrimastix pyriformis]|uniref:Ribosomal biogenesis protein LAS1L n=1 Tax=Paratrimastix pyriformis TaxID=342808 RepID=A0ABQ8URH3_9EUKA|nr:putative Ribosomal biogenesis protein LAS1L [Paratrimastix pyriformis]